MFSIFNNAWKFFQTSHDAGIRRAVTSVCCYFLANDGRKLERKYGLDIQGSVLLDELMIDSEHKSQGFFYGASPARLVRLFLANLPHDLSDYVFVDVGSGKGLVLLLASGYKFKKILGLEFAKELHDIAIANIEKFKCPNQRCHDIQSICMDATNFEIPSGNCVLFFGNPFSEAVMEKLLGNINESCRRDGQKMFVAFQQLVEEDAIGQAEIIPMLEAASFLTERKLRYGSLLDRLLFSLFKVRLFETAS